MGETVRNPKRVKWKLIHNAGQFSIYVIALAASPHDQLEIIHSGYLKQGCFDTEHMLVVGFASSRQEAVEIIARLAQKVVKETGNADIRRYILES